MAKNDKKKKRKENGLTFLECIRAFYNQDRKKKRKLPM
jgi:hypothetical protein